MLQWILGRFEFSQNISNDTSKKIEGHLIIEITSSRVQAFCMWSVCFIKKTLSYAVFLATAGVFTWPIIMYTRSIVKMNDITEMITC